MNFKKIKVLKFDQSISSSHQQLLTYMIDGFFNRSHGSSEGTGWCDPIDDSNRITDQNIMRRIGNTNCFLVSLKNEILKIPNNVLNYRIAKKVAEAEIQQNIILTKNEITSIKDEVNFELMMIWITAPSITNAIINFDEGLIIVDSTNEKNIEMFIDKINVAGIKAVDVDISDILASLSLVGSPFFEGRFTLVGAVLNTGSKDFKLKGNSFTTNKLAVATEDGASIVGLMIDCEWLSTVFNDFTLYVNGLFNLPARMVYDDVVEYLSTTTDIVDNNLFGDLSVISAINNLLNAIPIDPAPVNP